MRRLSFNRPEPTKKFEEPMVRRRSAGGNRIRTIGPALVKGLSAVADERCRTDKLDGVIKHRSTRETTVVGRGASLDGRLFSAGPMVRIRFPPAVSLQTTEAELARRGFDCPYHDLAHPGDPYRGHGKNKQRPARSRRAP